MSHDPVTALPDTIEFETGCADEMARDWLQARIEPGGEIAQEERLEAHMDLVRSEVARISARIPRYVCREELQLAAVEALFLSLQKFDSSLGAPFEGYARKRIRGALIDTMRRMDGVPKNARRAARKLASATQEFMNRNERGPSEEELAEELNVSTEELHRLEFQSSKGNRQSLDAPLYEQSSEREICAAATLADPGGAISPLEHVIASETKAALVEALQSLPERERAVLVLHYYEGIRLCEIAEAMSVSEARASQIHSTALNRLRDALKFRRKPK